MKSKKRELKEWEERLQARERDIEDIMAKNKDKIEKYKKVIEEEIIQKR
jgi:hypothetical protein